MFLYERKGDVTYSTKIKVLGHDTAVFLDTVVPPGTSKSVKSRFLTDAFNAGMKQYVKLHKRR